MLTSAATACSATGPDPRDEYSKTPYVRRRLRMSQMDPLYATAAARQPRTTPVMTGASSAGRGTVSVMAPVSWSGPAAVWKATTFSALDGAAWPGT